MENVKLSRLLAFSLFISDSEMGLIVAVHDYSALSTFRRRRSRKVSRENCEKQCTYRSVDPVAGDNRPISKHHSIVRIEPYHRIPADCSLLSAVLRSFSFYLWFWSSIDHRQTDFEPLVRSVGHWHCSAWFDPETDTNRQYARDHRLLAWWPLRPMSTSPRNRSPLSSP